VRVALFTPFSPGIGGGSVQLRSHLQQMPGLDVDWYYLAQKPAQGERWHLLGSPLTSAQFLSDLSARTGLLPGSKAAVRNLVKQIPADLYWVVAHNEGISVAAELLDLGKKVHLTVHDDPFGTWIRSDRYRLFRPLLSRTFPRILRSAQSIDVTSWGMRDLYRQKYGVKCFALYLHVPQLQPLNIVPDPALLTVGHIGTLYHPEPFRRFIAACKKIAAQQQRTLRFIRIGTSSNIDAIASANPGVFDDHPDLTEDAAIPVLASCDFLYAMYPPGQRFELFRKTSLPVKLSTYVQAQRPIFAHAPGDSTLARIVSPYNVGQVCDSIDQNEIEQKVSELLNTPPSRDNFESLRRQLMCFTQVEQLHAALRGENWQRFPEFDFPL
jgi:hypothetical protein